VLYGLVGAGTTTALGTIAVGLAEAAPPHDLHLYVLDFDAGGTMPLSGLPHAGAVVGPAERERQIRLIRRLAAEVERRKDLLARAALDQDTEWPRIVLFVDNFAGFTAAFDAPGDGPVKDALGRLITDGPGVGVVSVLTAARTNGVPVTLAGAVPNKLVFRMADPLAATMLGLRRLPSDLPVGRAIDVVTRSEIQVALADEAGLAAAVAAVAAGGGPAKGRPLPIEELPTDVPVDRVEAQLRVSADPWFIPVGIGDADLEIVGFSLGPGDHILVAGEARSGRSTVLCAIAKMAAEAQCDLAITAVALRPSPLRDAPGITALVTEPDRLAAAVAGLDERAGPQLVLIDDADMVDDSGVLKGLAACRLPDVHVIAAARRDLKTQYQHWAKDLCRSRVGLWLRPSPGLDGDLWSTPMPRHIPPGMPPGRGLLVADGTVELVQTARP
jgi:S-DNA-T family DNA segregation ATPase FtsK/SpoIIIE